MKNLCRLARSAALVFDNITTVPSSISFFSTGSPGNLEVLLPSIDVAVTGCSCSSPESGSLGSAPRLQFFNFSGNPNLLPLGRFDGTNFNLLSPNTENFSANMLFGARPEDFASVSGTVNLTQVQTNGNFDFLIGDATVTSVGAGSAVSMDILPGSTGNFSWTISNGPGGLTLTQLSEQPAGFESSWVVGPGQITDITPEIPRPGAIKTLLPLFATGLGGFDLLGWRRKRRAQA